MNLSPEFLYGVGTIVLLGTLIWGFTRNGGRNRANDPLTDKATRDLYDHPDRYPQEKKDLEKKVRPSREGFSKRGRTAFLAAMPGRCGADTPWL